MRNKHHCGKCGYVSTREMPWYEVNEATKAERTLCATCASKPWLAGEYPPAPEAPVSHTAVTKPLATTFSLDASELVASIREASTRLRAMREQFESEPQVSPIPAALRAMAGEAREREAERRLAEERRRERGDSDLGCLFVVIGVALLLLLFGGINRAAGSYPVVATTEVTGRAATPAGRVEAIVHESVRIGDHSVDVTEPRATEIPARAAVAVEVDGEERWIQVPAGAFDRFPPGTRVVVTYRKWRVSRSITDLGVELEGE